MLNTNPFFDRLENIITSANGQASILDLIVIVLKFRRVKKKKKNLMYGNVAILNQYFLFNLFFFPFYL